MKTSMSPLPMLLWLACLGSAQGAIISESPIPQVVSLIKELKRKIETDGAKEQQEYDKYACWVEDTLSRKAGDIKNAEETLAELEVSLRKLSGEAATHTAEIKNLEKLIKENQASQKDATELRNKERSEYKDETSEAEQAMGALEAAIKVLTGAGTGKKAFLGTLQEAQLLGVAAGIRGVLKTPSVSVSVSAEDFEMVKHFAERPQDFIGAHDVSAVQMSRSPNPFGDYAPQSTRIQGIMKGLYDGMAADLEKSTAEEADKQKAYEGLMETKEKELKTLQETLQDQKSDKATAEKKLAEGQTLREDTTEQLKADEQFFEDTKDQAQNLAEAWSDRTQSRTAELSGIGQAIRILESNAETFKTGSETFLQFSSSADDHKMKVRRTMAVKRLKEISKRSQSATLSGIAMALKTGGSFDKVIEAIDKLMAELRKEEQEDIAHKDLCENRQNDNANDLNDSEHTIDVATTDIKNLNLEADEVKEDISKVTALIQEGKQQLADMLEKREDEHKQFKVALETDVKAIAAIEDAINVLLKFYKDNKIPLQLVQKSHGPEYSVDKDKAPEMSWAGNDYTGAQSESTGIIAIMEMIKEDIEKEVQESRAAEAKDQEEFKNMETAGRNTVQALSKRKTALRENLQDLQLAIDDKEGHKAAAEQAKEEQSKLKDANKLECSWLELFEDRRTKRKAEMDGLQEAKAILSGSADDQFS